MSLEMNVNLTKMYDFAKDAVHQKKLSGEDSVIQTRQNAVGLVAHKWKVLGSRSDAFKAGNLATRTAFYTSVCEQFGGADRIPQSVKDVLKLADFKLNGDGEVTSRRPLTARRIKLVCEAIQAHNLAHDPLRFDPKRDPDYGVLPTNLQTAYERYVAERAKALADAGSTDLAKLSVATFVKGALRSVQACLKDLDAPAAEACQGFVDVLMEDVRDGEIAVPQMRCLGLLWTLVGAEDELRNQVAKNAGDLQHLQQAQILQAAVDRLAKGVADRCAAIYNRNDRDAQPRVPSRDDLLKGFDFRAADNLPALRTQNAYKAMMAHLKPLEQKFAACAGNVNEKFRGKLGNKFENLVEALRCFKALREEPAIPQKLNEAVARYRKHVEKRQQGGQVVKAPKVPMAAELKQGRDAAELLRKIMGVDAHANGNTAAQLLEAYEIFCAIDSYFFKALDLDRANGNTAMFDKLMDALNTTGCLQARCEFLQEVRMELDPALADVKDITVSLNDTLTTAMGKAVQMVRDEQKLPEDADVDYKAVAERLVAAVKDRDGNPRELATDFDLGQNCPTGTKRRVTLQFLMLPAVADPIKACLCCFKD